MSAPQEWPTFPFPDSSYLGPDPRYARLRAEQPVARVEVAGGGHAWVITRYEDVRTALADPRLSRAALYRPGAPRIGGLLQAPPEMIASLDPPEHTRLRRLVTKAFTAGRVEGMRPWIQRLVDELLDEMAGKQPPADLVEQLASPLPMTVICELLGVPGEDREQFHTWVRQFANVTGDPEEAQQGGARMGEYIIGLIAAKRAEPADDLLSALIAARDEEDSLSEQELVVFGYALLGAGFDTTACQIANSVLALIEHHRDQWRLLTEDPGRIPVAVEELLRRVNLFATDTSGMPRVATADVEIGGAVIPAGDAVFLVLSSANRDESVFADADRLDLTRADNRHIAFGHGIHRCLGAPLARMELNIAIDGLVRRFPDLRLAVSESELRWQPGDVNHNLVSLPVEWGRA